VKAELPAYHHILIDDFDDASLSSLCGGEPYMHFLLNTEGRVVLKSLLSLPVEKIEDYLAKSPD
jgi:hypothetical protein